MQRKAQESMSSKPNPSTSVKLITYGAFLAFFMFGFVDNLKGPTLPTLLDDLDFSYSVGGTILLGSYFGFLVATLLTGPLSDIAGKKVIIFVACACLFVGMIGYSLFSLFWTLTLAMIVLGLGMGALEVGGNLIIVDLHPRNRGRYLNLLAFFHGIGSMLVPLYAGQLLDAGVSWRSIYQSSVLIVMLLFVYFLRVKYPQAATSAKNKLDLKKLGRSAVAGDMVLYYVAIAIYVAAEIGLASWLVEFLQQAKSQSVTLSTLFLSLFFGAITVGRFMGSFFVERVGYHKSVLIASAASVLCVTIGTFAPSALAFLIPLTGLFFSIIFPTITAAVSDLHQENVGTILGLLFTFGGIGGMLGPWTIGVFSDRLGIQLGFGTIAVFCLAMTILFGLLVGKRQQSSLSSARPT
jgi:FHS family glucose/mannose:H+ symporter-like MFS transporter